MSAPKSAQQNLDEQFLSADWNAVQTFGGAELSDMLLRMLAVDRRGILGTAPQPIAGFTAGGVLSGLDCTLPGGMTVQLNPGQAFRVNAAPTVQPNTADNSAAGTDMSTWAWIRLAASQPFVLASPGAGVNWYLLEATDRYTARAQVNRQFWNPIGQFEFPQLTTKFLDPDATLALKGPVATAGAAMALLDAGSIPLAWFQVPTGTVALAYENVIDGRTMLTPGAFGRHGIVAGLSLAYVGANQLSVGNGSGFAGGFPVRALAAAEPTTFGLADMRFSDAAAAAIGTAPQANKAFYCYLVPNSSGAAVVSKGSPTDNRVAAGYTDNQGFALVVSSTAPDRAGGPSAAFAQILNYGAGPTHIGVNNVPAGQGVTEQPALFIGSICTDVNGNIIPFVRDGDDVILCPAQPTTIGPDVGMLDVVSTFLSGGGPNQTIAAAMTNGVPFPASAEAMIVDFRLFLAFNAGNLSNFYVHVLHPAFNVYAAANNHVQATLLCPAEPNSVVMHGLKQRRIRLDGGGNLYLATSIAPTVNMQVDSIYRGYVERPARLGF